MKIRYFRLKRLQFKIFFSKDKLTLSTNTFVIENNSINKNQKERYELRYFA